MRNAILCLCMILIVACGSAEEPEQPIVYDWSEALMVDFMDEGLMTFDDAHEFCESKTTDLAVYRMPTIDELRAHIWPDHDLFGPDGLCDTDDWTVECRPMELRVDANKWLCYWSDTEFSKNKRFVACTAGTGILRLWEMEINVMCLRLEK